MRTNLIFLAALGAIAAGCSGSREVPGPAGRETSKYEESFRPSDYDPEPGGSVAANDQRAAADSLRAAAAAATSTPEIVQGYRVQLFSSTSIDKAEATKKEAEAIFPGEWFYLEFDPPTYKVRAGNFLTRFEADRMAKQLSDKGFPNSWTVPERVYKNPPPPVREEPAPLPETGGQDKQGI
jgi:hypothetical protein